MNSNNYGSREACERLVKAGIVLETDAVFENHVWSGGNEWVLILKSFAGTNYELLPTPSMAEVWRELPEGTTLQKWALGYQAWIAPDYEKYHSQNTNPTDALIDLLIFVKGLDTPKST